MSTKAEAATTKQDQLGIGRRGFLAGTAAVGLSMVAPHSVAGAEANAKITVGLIGCGGRGKWIAHFMQQHGGYQFVSTCDYFPDRAASMAQDLKVPANRAFSGLDGYKRLLETKPDAVVVESPPYFHPEQSLAAVEAGCHVYCAKPIAVDVPGCLTMAEVGRKGTAGKKCVLVDFQTRTNEFYREAIRRVHAGDIGPLVSGEAVYYCGVTWGTGIDMNNPESRLRHWGQDRILSGDIITEQNIHALDVASWICNADPLRAVGSCGCQTRGNPAECNSHFAVVYTFPKDVLLTFASKQYGTGYDDIGCRMFGPEGMVDTHYFGLVRIVGQKSYKGGRIGNLYTEGAVQNIADFHKAITGGDYSNPTVAPSVRSNLTTILGRTAAYKKTEVTWDDMMKAAEKCEFSTKGLKS